MPVEVLRWGFDALVALSTGCGVAVYFTRLGRKERAVDAIIIRSLETQLEEKEEELENLRRVCKWN